jgi:hypothetical protein
VNPTTTVLRWYRQSTGQAAPKQQYTAQEVLQLLHPSAHLADVDTIDIPDSTTHPDGHQHADRTEAVRQAAARPMTWLDKVTNQQRREIGQLADRLPSLLFHHTSGGDLNDLVKQFGGWSTWRYERALEVAGTCIASHLNAPR